MDNTNDKDFKDFDDIIKARLENLAAYNFVPSAESWRALENKISDSESEELELDKTFSARLDNLKFEPQAHTWQAIETDLENIEDANNSFDALFSQKLKSIPTEFNPEHWRAFEPRINFFLRWHLRLKKYRVLEAAIFVLTIFPVLKLYDEARKVSENQNAVVSNSGANQNNYGSKEAGTKQLSTITSKKNQSTIWNGITESISHLLNNTERSKFAIAETKLEHDAFASFSPLNILGFNHNSVNADVDMNSKSSQQNETASATGDEVATNALNEIENKIWLNRNTQLLKTLPIPNLKESKISLEGLYKIKKNNWRAGILTAYNQDFITTKYILEGNTKSEYILQPSWSIGSTISFQRGNTEFESGIIYSEKTYQPAQAEQIVGSVASGYSVEQNKSISAHIISLPINVKQNILRNKKLRVYALGGATLSTIFAIDENKNESVQSLSAANSNFTPTPSRLSLPSYNGSTSNKPILSLNVGAGVEYKVAKKISIFAQPVLKYQVSTNGIGSLNDKVHSLSLEVGVKTTL